MSRKKSAHPILILLLIAFLTVMEGGSARAQVAQEQAQPQAQAAQQQVQTPPLPVQPNTVKTTGQARVKAVNGRQEEVTFFFDDADIFEVAQTIFGEVLRVNYIIDPKIKGRVNFRTTTPIHKDRVLPVMEIILRLNGIAVVQEGDMFRIIPINDIVREPAPIFFGNKADSVELKGAAVVQVVPLDFISSAEMTNVLTPFLTQGGTVLDVPKRNYLIIADTDANVKRLLQLVELFDKDTLKDVAQPKIYVYALQNSKADHVSRILQQIFLGLSAASAPAAKTAAKPGTPAQPAPAPAQQTAPSAAPEAVISPGTKIFPDEVTNSVVIYASPIDYMLVQGTIKQLDTIPRQVMIEAIVAAVALTDNLTFGMQWNLNTDLTVTDIKPFKNNIDLSGLLGFQGLAPLAASTFGFTATDHAGKVRLLIEALAEDNKAKILSSPHILVSDNREARIQVGDQIPIATSTTTTPIAGGTTATNTTTATIQYKDTGTILKVKPHINDSGLISLEISQEVSTANTRSVLGTEQFVISKRDVATSLVAQDGQTIVIGGLINEEDSQSKTGIPLLSKIPILGHLFGRTKDNKTRTELIILLTPRVVRNQGDAVQVTSDYLRLFRNVGKTLRLDDRAKGIQAEKP